MTKLLTVPSLKYCQAETLQEGFYPDYAHFLQYFMANLSYSLPFLTISEYDAVCYLWAFCRLIVALKSPVESSNTHLVTRSDHSIQASFFGLLISNERTQLVTVLWSW